MNQILASPGGGQRARVWQVILVASVCILITPVAKAV
jgi:hypothetical protein